MINKETGDGMERMTIEEFERRLRVKRYKKMIVYGYLITMLVPIIMCVFLFYKVSRLEQKLDYVLNEQKTEDTVLSVNGGTSASVKEEQVIKSEQAILGKSEQPVLGQTAEMQEIQKEEKTNRKRVYLTFDDGPSAYTGQILDILAANDVKATFFVIGKDEQYYDDYKRIVEEGHTIGMHSYTHVYKDFYRSRESFAEELTKLNALIYDITGTKSTIFRFPGGSSNKVSSLPIQTFISYLNENGIRYYDWNSLNGDAVTSGLSPEQLVNNIMRDVLKNQDSIVLMHDLQTSHSTVESLQLLIDTLKENGYEILPIDDETPLIQHVSYKSAEE